MSETRLLLKSTYSDGAGIGHCSYEVEDAHGRCFKGTLDANGQAEVVGLAPGPARLRCDLPPTDTFAPENYRGATPWPAQPKLALSRCAQESVAEVMAKAQSQPQTDSVFRHVINGEIREKIQRWQSPQENGNAGGRETP